jgi:hypothetical protein
MSRTSRCFAALFSKSGGPDALPAAERFLYLHPTDFFLASVESLFPARFFVSHKANCLPIVFSGHGQIAIETACRRDAVTGDEVREEPAPERATEANF